MTKILSILFSIILFALGLQANLICLKPPIADDIAAALISQTAAAASSSGTYGFSVGIAGDVNGKDIKSNTTQTTSISSNLQANNISISTNKDKDTSTNITGSNLIAFNNIDINTNNLNISSSQDTYISKQDTKELGGSIKFSIYGGGGGSLGLNYSQGHSNQESIINNNSQLIANNTLNLTQITQPMKNLSNTSYNKWK